MSAPLDIARLLAFIVEREAIRIKRERGEQKPWTDDQILRDWSFTNVHREDDRVTRWLAENWRAPHADDPDLWFAMVVARFVNWPDTLAGFGYPVPWKPDHFLPLMAPRKPRGGKNNHPPYPIRPTPSSQSRTCSLLLCPFLLLYSHPFP